MARTPKKYKLVQALGVLVVVGAFVSVAAAVFRLMPPEYLVLTIPLGVLAFAAMWINKIVYWWRHG